MNLTNRIPFLDLVAPHEELKEELCAVFETALKTGGFIGGPMVEGFEQDFASFCESRHCVGVASGTDALRFALIAAGINPGEIVITVPNTFIATAEAITQAGARPAFVDVDERTYNMDPERLREYLETACTMDDRGRPIDAATGERVAAIVPVHLYGQMCDMDAILEIAGALQPHSDRRCMPGARRGVLFREGKPLADRGLDGTSRRIQLLSGKEPGRLRRSRRRDDGRRRPCAKNPHAARPRPGAQVLSPHRRI